MILSRRIWCGLCGQDLEEGRRRCACTAAVGHASAEPPHRLDRIHRLFIALAQLFIALAHAGLPGWLAVVLATNCVRRGWSC